MHPKIARDPILSCLAARHGEALVWASGFFLDDDPADAPLDDVDWLSTPVPRRAAGEGRPAVLLSTGAFCPIHDGHVAMMERARAAAEAAGFDVLGGYLSPGHDRYIGSKCGTAAIPAAARIEACARAAAETDWLLVDPWEALHRRVAVNYTDVVARLRAYVHAHVDPRTVVLYVCGGDNARFALAFAGGAPAVGCVVVGRPGAAALEEEARARVAALAPDAPILFAPGDHPAASRAIRAAIWTDARPRRVVVRCEDARAVRTLGLDRARLERFQEGLARTLARDAEVRTVSIAPPPDGAVISLDPMRPARHNLALSRLYALGGAQLLGHVARPGAPELLEQVRAIPPGAYALADDDRVTGGTLEAARRLLAERARITATELAVLHGEDEEVVDSRDFLLGADHGGLVVALPRGRIGRAPYLFPYVDPTVRASVRPSRSHAFAIEIWRLNAELFAGSGLRVRDLPPAARLDLGDGLLEDVCRAHARRIEELAPLP